ncbi:MAG: hypothetical protein ACREXQ_12810, partial [Polaromonas sp.]
MAPRTSALDSAYCGTLHTPQNALRRILWHLDFHHGSRKVLTRQGEWVTPMLLGVLDDRSRLVCHLQWY